MEFTEQRRIVIDQLHFETTSKNYLRIVKSANSNGNGFGRGRDWICIRRRFHMSSNNKDPHFSVLGLQHGATPDEIKKAYRSMAMKYHPDKNPDKSAHERFNKVTEAYNHLMDKSNKRSSTNSTSSGRPTGFGMGSPFGFDSYDPDEDLFNEGVSAEELDRMFRKAAGGQGFPGGGFNTDRGRSSSPPPGFTQGFSSPFGDGDPFFYEYSPFEEAPFFYAPPRPHRNREPTQRTPDLVFKMGISLEDFFTGKSINVSYWRNTNCNPCKGTGVKAGGTKIRCKTCGGSGHLLHKQKVVGGFDTVVIPCKGCQASGFIIPTTHVCPACMGNSNTNKEHTVNVRITPGAHHGDMIVFKGQGNERPGWKAGDFKVTLDQKKHPVFTRLKRGDLFTEINIPLSNALCGLEYKLTHLDGRNLLITEKQGPNQSVITPDTVRVIVGEGMPDTDHQGQKGDLYIRYKIVFPDIPMMSSEVGQYLSTQFRQSPDLNPGQTSHSSGAIQVHTSPSKKHIFEEEVDFSGKVFKDEEGPKASQKHAKKPHKTAGHRYSYR